MAVPADDGDGWTAAALVTARPRTAYLKIVDAVGDVPAAVGAVVAHAHGQGLAQVKWEGWTAVPGDAAAAGFTALRPPLAQVEGADGPTTGYVRWLSDGEVSEPRTTGRARTSRAAPSPHWSPRRTRGPWNGRSSTAAWS